MSSTLAIHYSTLSTLRFNDHYARGPGLASTRMSQFWILLELRMMDVVVTTGAMRCAKLQSNCHHQQTNIQFLQAGCPFCDPTNSVRALEESSLLKAKLAECLRCPQCL